jgi:hypothetical protein
VLVRQSIDPETIAAIRSAPRALVYLSVDWSVPERRSRSAFHEAVERLSKEHANLGIGFYALDEEADPCREFLSSLGFVGVHVKYACGCGSLIWLEDGRNVAYAFAVHFIGTSGVVARTLSLWGGPT